MLEPGVYFFLQNHLSQHQQFKNHMKHNTSFLLIAVTEFQLKNLPVQNLYTFTKLLQAIYFSKHDVNKEFWQSLVRFEDRPQLILFTYLRALQIVTPLCS